jgi:hypothetical protein
MSYKKGRKLMTGEEKKNFEIATALWNEYLKVWKGTYPKTGKPIIDRKIVEDVFDNTQNILEAATRAWEDRHGQGYAREVFEESQKRIRGHGKWRI